MNDIKQRIKISVPIYVVKYTYICNILAIQYPKAKVNYINEMKLGQNIKSKKERE